MTDIAVLVNLTDTSIVSVENGSTAVTNIPSSSIISIIQESTVVVESSDPKVVLTGLLGPQGPAGQVEEEIMYSKRVDFATQSIIYRGEAVVGTAESSSLWRIRKVVIGNDDDVTETWADGSAEFTKTWSLRDQYTYY